jgi:hypothetical protein
MEEINKNETIKNILVKCTSSIGYSIDIEKFNKERDNIEFLIAAAKFCEAEIVYI